MPGAAPDVHCRSRVNGAQSRKSRRRRLTTTPPGAIRLLSGAAPNQLATGEIAERHGSTDNDIGENAIDTGAKNIQIDGESSRIGRVRVSDDGTRKAETVSKAP